MSTTPGYWTLELIYPEQAKQYLAAMGRNRPPSRARIGRYVSAIKSGKWRLTHQGIAFNCDGSLKDGQHRLNAIVEAGVPVQMWVYRGLPLEAMRVIDTHGPRTDQNALYIDGLEVDIKDTATAKSMLHGFNMKGGKNGVADRDDLHAFVVRHQEALTFVGSRLKSSEKGVGHSSVSAAIARAWYSVDRNRLHEFCTVLSEGVTENKENFAALRLRSWLQTSTHNSGSWSQRASIYRKTQAALRAFIERRDITKLYEVNDEQFPLPEETDPDGHK